MPRKRKVSLGHRERQIVDAVRTLGEASVFDVLNQLPDPPTYSSVRKMLSVLEEKGVLKHRVEKTKFIYRPVESNESARRTATQGLLQTFFGGNATEAVNTILDLSSENLTADDFERLKELIRQAQSEGR